MRTVAHVFWFYAQVHQFKSMNNAELFFEFLLTSWGESAGRIHFLHGKDDAVVVGYQIKT
jgi:hypothetical protein